MDQPEVLTEQRRDALTPDQAERLIASTRASKPRMGMTGEDRAMLYMLGAVTGLRRCELQSLIPESFDLDADTPTVTPTIPVVKRRATTPQPLPSWFVPEVRNWLAGKSAGVRLFPKIGNTAPLFRADAKAAGLDATFLVFHSLRHTFVSWVVMRSGASPKPSPDTATRISRSTATHISRFTT
jgi:integrase